MQSLQLHEEGMDSVKLAEIVGYRLDMARCAALRSVHRLLADTGFRPADTTALLLIKERPGCDQTELGHALAGNRSVGMKVATRLEARGLLTRRQGRDRRSKGLYITPQGEAALADLLAVHAQAEARLTAGLSAAEHVMLLWLLDKVERAVLDEEAGLDEAPRPAEPRETAEVQEPA
jgi:DNA-binding MarR family transcriptional regulator